MRMLNYLAAVVLATGIAAGPAFAVTQVVIVPTNAPLVAQTKGPFTFRSFSDGNVLIINKTKNRLVYSGPVRAGDSVQIDTRRNTVLVNNVVVADRLHLGRRHEYQIFMQSPGVSLQQRTIERQTVIERDIR